MTARTELAYVCNFNIWPVVERWSNIEDARKQSSNGSRRLYQKGRGLLVAPMMFSFRQEGADVWIEAWVRCNLLLRICSAFILPAEMSVESGGFRGVLPRKIARDALNRFLQQIGAAPLQ